MYSISTSYIRKWLGIPPCLSDAGLFGKNIQKLPLKSINIDLSRTGPDWRLS